MTQLLLYEDHFNCSIEKRLGRGPRKEEGRQVRRLWMDAGGMDLCGSSATDEK